MDALTATFNSQSRISSRGAGMCVCVCVWGGGGGGAPINCHLCNIATSVIQPHTEVLPLLGV